MIGPILYWRAKRNQKTPFDRYLVDAGDLFAWRARVAGGGDLPGWLRPASEPLHLSDVRILFGRPARTLVLLDEVETAADAPIRSVWPSLRGFIHAGEPFGPYVETYHRRLGKGITLVAGERDDDFDCNAFGERLDRANMDEAVAEAAHECDCAVAGFTVDAEYPTVSRCRGRHVWQIAFEKLPADLAAFGRALDAALAEHHENYAAARAWLREPMVRLTT